MALPPPVAASAPSIGARDRVWRVASALLVIALAGLMLGTVLDYGMTGDEGVQHRYARRVLRWYASLGADRSAVADEDISMYGGFFEAIAEAAASVSPLDPFETRHVVSVAFALAAFLAALRMGRHLAGPLGGFLCLAFLALTPPFYGHAFNNPKDTPFASTFAVAVCVILVVSDRSPRLRGRDVAASAAAIGAAAGVRVAGIALFGFALTLWLAVAIVKARTLEPTSGSRVSARGDLVRLGASWLAVVLGGWVLMVLFWPWAQVAPLLHPWRALGAFSRFWETMVVFYDGQYVPNGAVSRFYLPTWFALTLPETYLAAAVMGLLRLGELFRSRDLSTRTRLRVVQCAWVAAVAVLPVGWVVARHTPLYDGLRHFLFVVPLLAVLAGVGAASWLQSRPRRRHGIVGATVLGLLGAITAADMVALHPYEALYFNRVVAGGLARAVERYETDYWCLTYKEGAEWLLARFAGAHCEEKVRVAGQSILLQTSYYFRKTEEGRRLFSPVSLDDDPHFAMTTTRFGDHRHTPGRVIHTVERQGASLLYIFEVRAPACRSPSP